MKLTIADPAEMKFPQTIRAIRQRWEATQDSGVWWPGCFSHNDKGCQCKGILCDAYCGSIATISVNNGKRITDGGNDSPPPDEARANLIFIATAHQDVPFLLREIAKLKRQLRDAKRSQGTLAAREPK